MEQKCDKIPKNLFRVSIKQKYFYLIPDLSLQQSSEIFFIVEVLEPPTAQRVDCGCGKIRLVKLENASNRNSHSVQFPGSERAKSFFQSLP